MNILLLGGTGYLGKNLVTQLSADGHQLICAVRERASIDCLQRDNVTIIPSQYEIIDEILCERKVEWVINAVCTYSPNESLYNDMLEANLIYPLKILNLCIKNNVKYFLNMDTNLPSECNFYSFSKHKFSEFAKYFSNKITVYNLRLEMFYGGMEEPDTRFLKSCKNSLLRNAPIELTSGEQKRDLIRIEDLIAIISRIIIIGGQKGYVEWEIGYGENHSIIEILNYMRSVIGSTSLLRFGSRKSRDVEPDTISDISWKNTIDYEFMYSYWDGLGDYMKQNRGI